MREPATHEGKPLAPAPKDPIADNPNYDGEKDPGNGVTLVSREQLLRSEQMEKEGIEKWKAEHDSRDAKDIPKRTVPLPGEAPPEPEPTLKHESRR